MKGEKGDKWLEGEKINVSRKVREMDGRRNGR